MGFTLFSRLIPKSQFVRDKYQNMAFVKIWHLLGIDI